MITLQPMTPDEYARFKADMYEDYAQSRSRGMGTPIEQERIEGARQIDELTKDGLQSTTHHYWTLRSDVDGNVGVLWVFVDAEKQRAFIYFIGVDEAYRGKGYAAQALTALEAAVKPLGAARIELNVFGDNTTAQRLYQRMGYQPSAIFMRKEI